MARIATTWQSVLAEGPGNLRKPIAIVLGLGLWLCVVLAVITVFLSLVPRMFGLELMVVTSGSMAPAFRTGDALLVDPNDVPDTGETVVFATRDHGSARAHRVVETVYVGGKPFFRTKGDANPVADSDLIPSDAAYGSVLGAVPHAGWLLATLGNPLFGLGVFIAPVVWLAVREMVEALTPDEAW